LHFPTGEVYLTHTFPELKQFSLPRKNDKRNSVQVMKENKMLLNYMQKILLLPVFLRKDFETKMKNPKGKENYLTFYNLLHLEGWFFSHIFIFFDFYCICNVITVPLGTV